MSEYRAPVEDMMFVLQDVVGMETLPVFDEGLLDEDTVAAVLEEAGKLASSVLSPLNAQGDRQGNKLDGHEVTTAAGFKEAYRSYCEGGWNGVPFPADYGGQDLPWAVAFPVQEMWQAANMSFGLCPLLNQAAIEAIYRHGNQEQKDMYLEKLISGQWTGTMNLTEPQAGSDLALIKSVAEKQDDGAYRLRGQKIYITYGEHDLTENIIHTVLARTPDAPEGVKGLSLFIVPKFIPDENGNPGERNDLVCTSLEHKLGIHASPTCVMNYGDHEGAAAYLVGEEGQGLKYMFTMMNNARLCVGLQGVAIAERAYQHAFAYAKERVQGTALDDKSGARLPIIEHADVRRMLLEMKARVQAGRMMAYQAALALDQAAAGNKKAQERADLLTPVVKSWCTDMAVTVASLGIQVFGGMGFIEETGAAQYYRDARILPIYEGTNGIQAMDLVFRKTLMNKGSYVQDWLAEARETVAALQNADGLDDLASPLEKALESLSGATDFIVHRGGESLDDVAAVAVPYQQAFGDIAGGVMMARAALAAASAKEEGQENRTFCDVKIRTAHFYMAHILPAGAAHCEIVVQGSDAVTGITPEML